MDKTKYTSTDQRNKKQTQPGDSATVKAKLAHRKEIEDVLKNAKKPSEAQAVLGIAGQHAGILPKELMELAPVEEFQNPELAYKLYYRTLGKLRREYLLHNPEIEVPEQARRELNKEIRVFLKEAKPHADSRMARTKRMADAVQIFIDWSDECKAGDVANLYGRFCTENDNLTKKK